MAVVAPLPACFLSTSTSRLQLSIKKDAQHFLSLQWATQRNMEEKLPPALETALSYENISLSEIVSFVVDIGPGSFTGIRLGLSFARGLTAISQATFFPICSLDLIALSHLDFSGTYAVLRDAKRNRVYYRLYERSRSKGKTSLKRLTRPGLISTETFLRRYGMKIKVALTDDASLQAFFPASFPLVYDEFASSASLFSSLTKRCSRLQLAPLYLQSFP